MSKQSPASARPPASTQELIAHIWDTLQWHKTCEVAFLIAVIGMTATAILAALGLFTQAMTAASAAWPAITVVTSAVTYRAAHRSHR